jgi:hypothetical protein
VSDNDELRLSATQIISSRSFAAQAGAAFSFVGRPP